MSQNAGSEEAERHGTRFRALFLGILSTQSRIGAGCLATVSILTGVMLSVARAAGETASLLFTALFFDYWSHAPFVEPTSSLAVLIYNFAGVPYPEQIAMARVAALLLVVLALAANIAAQAGSGQSETTR